MEDSNLYTKEFEDNSYVCMKYANTMRYSNTFSLMKESIADHSAQVALLILMHFSEYPILFGNMGLGRLLTHAICHDLSEIISGDVVSPIKNLTPEIKKSFDQIEKTSIGILSHKRSLTFKQMLTTSENYTLGELEQKYFKFVDVLVVSYKAHEELKLNNLSYRRVAIENAKVLSTKFNEFISIVKEWQSAMIDLEVEKLTEKIKQYLVYN